jgi:hypothetical protein
MRAAPPTAEIATSALSAAITPTVRELKSAQKVSGWKDFIEN